MLNHLNDWLADQGLRGKQNGLKDNDSVSY